MVGTVKMISIYVVVLLVMGCVGLTPQCIDENGDPVDWFYIYKLPKDKTHTNQLVRRGVAYMYLTPDTMKDGWVVSEKAIRNPESMPGRTLAPMYQNADKLSLIYNDQPPVATKSAVKLYKRAASAKSVQKRKINQKPIVFRGRKGFTMKGHTKGVILGDSTTSIWMVHSVPKFPPIPSFNGSYPTVNYSYPITGMKFGQSFLCITVPTTTLEKIAVQLKYNEPLILYHNLPATLKTKLPNLSDVMDNRTVQSAPWSHLGTFDSLGGWKFTSFAKSNKFNADLYSDLVAQQLKVDLFVETWINGPDVLDSDCSKTYQVQNVLRLKSREAKMAFSSHQDHSKWALSTTTLAKLNSNTTQHWVCVGDINRAASQEHRGGGTVCTAALPLWEQYVKLIDSVKQCNSSLKYYN